MKQRILLGAFVALMIAGGCVRLHKKAGAWVRPSEPTSSPPAATSAPPAAVTTPLAATSPAPVLTVTPAPPKPRHHWWSLGRKRPPSPPRRSVPPPLSKKIEPPTPPPEPRRSWWRKEPKPPPPAPAAPVRSVRIYRIKPGDPIVITLRGIPQYPGGQQVIEGILDENGAINLPFLNVVQGAGKTPSELEREIRDRYINEGYYRDLGVNIIIPSQSYFVRGEVRNPGRFQLIGEVTILQALAAAGGFTEFANPRAVELIRGDQRSRVNVRELEKYPARDRELEAGDVIIVPRSAF